MGKKTEQTLASIGTSVAQLDLLRVVGQELKLPLTHIANAASMLSQKIRVTVRLQRCKRMKTPSKR